MIRFIKDLLNGLFGWKCERCGERKPARYFSDAAFAYGHDVCKKCVSGEDYDKLRKQFDEEGSK